MRAIGVSKHCWPTFPLNHLLVVGFEPTFSLRSRAVQERVEERARSVLGACTEKFGHPTRPGKAIACLATFSVLIRVLLPASSFSSQRQLRLSSSVTTSPTLSRTLSTFSSSHQTTSWTCTFSQSTFHTSSPRLLRLAIQILLSHLAEASSIGFTEHHSLYISRPMLLAAVL